MAAGLLGLPGAPAADGPPSSGVDPSFAILHGLYWLCANLAAAGPLCLVVDDAHWADAPSLRYLAFLLTRLEELDVALVVATRPREAGTDAELLATVTTDPSAEVIRLRSADESRRRPARGVEARRGSGSGLRRCLPARNARDAVPAARARGGAERRRHRSDRGGRAHVERIGARTVGRSIRLRLRRLPEHAGRLAGRWRSSSRATCSRRRDSRASTRPRQPTRPSCWRPRDPRVRPAADVRPSDRPQRDLLGALQRRARTRPPPRRRAARRATGRERARRRAPAGSEPAADGWVVERLVEAARAAAEAGAPESEAVFLRRALAEPPPPGDRSALLLELGMAEASAGLAGWPEHLQRAVDTAPNPRQPPTQPWCWGSRSAALSASPRRSRSSIVRRRRSIPATPSSRSCSRLRPSSPG